MAKISPVSIKYMVKASFESEGPVEKPDVIGAIFGQTEGLLGSELEMRELQKEGKIGRIEVNLETVDGKSVGEILVPTALDKSETTLIAAALETIDRIGPTLAKIKINKIEDVRGEKRDFILSRARELLGHLDNDGTEDMAKSVISEARAAKIQEYGDEKLPAGDIERSSEVIVVEGRADVVNLLKNRVNNVIGMNGTVLPRTIAKLGESKELTLFVDGDRGGKLIAKNVALNAKIAFIASAPDGKEVEELSGKEILQSLRKKIPAKEFIRMIDRNGNGGYYRESYRDNSYSSSPARTSEESESVKEPAAKFAGSEEDAKKRIRESYSKVQGMKVALILDSNLDIIKKVSTREVARSIRMSRTPVAGVVIDGTATNAIINTCDENSVQFLGATNFGTVENARVKMISL